MTSITFTDVCVSYYLTGKVGKPSATPKASSDYTTESVKTANFVGGMIKHKRFFTEVKALQDINLEVKQGERIGLIGVNGSGKTTMLKTCAGHLAPSSGTVDVQGDCRGLMTIGGSLQGGLTGRRNVELKALYYGVGRKELKSVAERAKQVSGLGEFFEMPVNSYSSGMTTRLTMSFLTLVKGDVLILDEWVGTGDATVTEEAGYLQDKLLESADILMIASHSESILLDWTSKLIWMHRGKIMRFGETEKVLPDYQEFVAALKRGAKTEDQAEEYA